MIFCFILEKKNWWNNNALFFKERKNMNYFEYYLYIHPNFDTFAKVGLFWIICRGWLVCLFCTGCWCMTLKSPRQSAKLSRVVTNLNVLSFYMLLDMITCDVSEPEIVQVGIQKYPLIMLDILICCSLSRYFVNPRESRSLPDPLYIRAYLWLKSCKF